MGFQRKQTVHKLFFGHLKTKDGHSKILPERHVLGNIEHKRGLSHGRARCDQHQIRPLKAGKLVIQVNKAGGNTGDGSLCLRRAFNHVQRI